MPNREIVQQVLKEHELNQKIAEVKSCLLCSNLHKAKDCEFTLIPDDQYRKEVPKGKCFINIDLYWCSKPETEEDDFSVLSWGTPTPFDKETWFPMLADVCESYDAQVPSEVK